MVNHKLTISKGDKLMNWEDEEGDEDWEGEEDSGDEDWEETEEDY